GVGGKPKAKPAAAMKKDEGSAGPFAHEPDAAIADGQGRDRMGGHSSRSLTRCGTALRVDTPRTSLTYTLISGPNDCAATLRTGEQDAARTHREEDLNVRASRSEDEQGLPDPGHHEGVGARRSWAALAGSKGGARYEEGRGAAAHRRGRALRHRSRDHLSWTARAHPRRHAAQSELHAGTRIHGHRGCARARGRRIPDRTARHGRNPC